jgi:hypothetical protein
MATESQGQAHFVKSSSDFLEVNEREDTMKTTLNTLLIVSLMIALPVFASDPILTSLEGGRMEFDLSAASNLLAGPGISSVSTSGAALTRSDPFAVFSNPASWQIVREGVAIGVSLQPHLSVNTLPSMAQSSLDENVDGVLSGFSNSENVDYPELAGTVARKSNPLSSFAVIVPWNEWRFGVGYTRPISADMSITHDGLSQTINQSGDIASESLDMAIETVVDMNMNLTTNRYLLGASREFDKWSVGMSLSRTSLSLAVNGGYQVSGDVEYGAEVHSFNDPTDSWHNSFRGQANGTYEGSIYTVQTGMNYRLGKDVETDWTVAANMTLNFGRTMSGSMDVVIDEYLPFELSPADGVETFDIARIPDSVEITRTQENRYYPGSELTIETPHVFSVGIAKPNGLRPNLNLTAYAGNIAYSIDVKEKRVEDAEYTTNTYSRGITPLGAAYLGISPGSFFIGAGATVVKDMVEGYNGANGQELSGGATFVIPRIDLGMIIPLSSHLRAEMLMVALPEDAMRIGFIYEF